MLVPTLLWAEHSWSRSAELASRSERGKGICRKGTVELGILKRRLGCVLTPPGPVILLPSLLVS